MKKNKKVYFVPYDSEICWDSEGDEYFSSDIIKKVDEGKLRYERGDDVAWKGKSFAVAIFSETFASIADMQKLIMRTKTAIARHDNRHFDGYTLFTKRSRLERQEATLRYLRLKEEFKSA
jgi:hypothetical protein